MMLGRDELISEMLEARQEWDAAVAGIAHEDALNLEISRGWTYKDVVGHLATYIRLNVRHLELFKKRKRIASMRARNWYQFNKREVVRLKRMPLKRLFHDLDSGFDRLLAEMETLSDEDLKASFPSPWSPLSGGKVRLGTILRADVSRHLREHARDVRKRRASANRGSAAR